MKMREGNRKETSSQELQSQKCGLCHGQGHTACGLGGSRSVVLGGACL